MEGVKIVSRAVSLHEAAPRARATKSYFHPEAVFRETIKDLIAAIIVMLHVATASGYVLDGAKWPSSQTTYYVDIPGADGLWNSTFEGAMASWNANTVFKFYVVREYADPCDYSVGASNGVAFTATDCGVAFGSALAVTKFLSDGVSILQASIVFNAGERWNVYSGPSQPDVFDFRRTALHELGHGLGLDHEDRVPSIMETFSGDIVSLTADDIAGVLAIYGSGGPIGGADDHGNSTGTSTLVGPNSRSSGIFESTFDIDMFRVELPTAGTLTVSTAGSTDTLGSLLNSEGSLIESNDDGSGDINFYISRDLPAGTYFIAIAPVSVEGTYSFTSRFQSNAGTGGTRLNVDGIVRTQGTNDPLCAMVLVSGKYQFSCGKNGFTEGRFGFNDLATEADGSVKLQIYADGFLPYKIYFSEPTSSYTALMQRPAGPCPNLNLPFTASRDTSRAGERVQISGNVVNGLDNGPINAMVLANGQYAFSSRGEGKFSFPTILDQDGQIKLQVYADGFAPLVVRLDTDPFSLDKQWKLTPASSCASSSRGTSITDTIFAGGSE